MYCKIKIRMHQVHVDLRFYSIHFKPLIFQEVFQVKGFSVTGRVLEAAKVEQ